MSLRLLVLVLATACSGAGVTKAASRPTSTDLSTTPAPAATTTAPSASPAASPSAALVGPVGTSVPRGFDPRSATFVSNRTGWVLGQAPCKAGMCDAIVRTRDGGRTWLAIPAPATSPDQLSAVRFANLSDGFITGTQLWATHDGGATWRVVPGYANVTELEAGGGRVWLIAQHGLRSAPVVGGAFTTEATPAGVMGLVPHGPDLFGTTTGGLPKLLVGRHGAPFVARSTPCVRDEAAIVGSRSSRQLLLVCAGGAGAGHQVKKAYISADAGRTWQRVGDPDPTSGTTISLTSRADFVIDHQQVAVSRDGGRTWRSSLAAEGGMGSGGFASDELGFAIGYFGQANAMQLSYDDGRTWKKVSF